MSQEWGRRSPEELLKAVQAEEAAGKRRGHLKIVLGYASGVGKSFRMLDEARRRRERGQDIVVGAVQPNVPPEVAALLERLEVIPLKQVGGGTAMDVEAIVRRHPVVCLVDGLAYDNPPGLKNATRWQDVQDLLDAGIKVIATVNVQYVEEMRTQVELLTGKRITQTVPEAFLKSADEIEIVDAPAEEGEAADRISKLRELALVLAADVVDYQLKEYLERHGLSQSFGAHERILVCITPRANVEDMLRHGLLVAQRFHGDLVVAYVRQPSISTGDQASLDGKLASARAAGAAVEILEGADPADTLLDYARSHGITQLFVGHTQRSGLSKLKTSPLDKLIWGGHGMDVRVFPQ